MFTGLGTTGEGYGLQETRIWGHYFFGGWGWVIDWLLKAKP